MSKIYRYYRHIIFLLASLIIIFISFNSTQVVLGQTNENIFEIDLDSLGYSTRTLQGPIANENYFFSLPADWVPESGTYVEFNLAYEAGNETEVAPAVLEVSLNGELLHTENFNTTTVTSSLRVDLPPDILRSAEEPTINRLQVSLLVAADCQDAELVNLIVDQSSIFHFVYQERPLFLDLSLYPKPLYFERAFETSPSMLMLPGEPNSSELEAAGIIVSGLGSQTDNNIPLDVVLGSQEPLTSTDQHAIIIGSPDRVPLLTELDLPLPLRERRLELNSEMPINVSPNDPFNYTLYLQNSSDTSQNLTLEDNISPLLSLEECQQCEEVEPGLLRWEDLALQAGETISISVQVRPKSLFLGDVVERTTTLFDESGQIINVDTLTSTVVLEATQATHSSSGKNPYFFFTENQGIPETDGIVQMLFAPWNPDRVIIVVTGLDEASIRRAAHALAIRNGFNIRGEFALVRSTQPLEPEISTQSQDIITLDSLGYRDLTIAGRTQQERIRFDVPRGGIFTEEANLALHFSYGAALSAISATLELELNGLPFTSIQLNPEDNNDFWEKIILPTSRLQSGTNEIDIQIGAEWSGACASPDELTRFWTTIYDDSFLFLPLEEYQEDLSFDLAEYPQIISEKSGLQDVTIIIPPNATSQEVDGMVQLLSSLGNAVGGGEFTFQVNLSDDNTIDDPPPGRNFILLGRPTRNSYLSRINDQLPQPFLPDRDEVRQEIDSVVYRIPADYDLGYIQLLPVPWDNDRVMLAVTGTTDVGFQWAIEALSISTLSRQLDGNLAIITNQEEIRTMDTRGKADNPEVTNTVDPLARFAEPTATSSPIVTSSANITTTSDVTSTEAVVSTDLRSSNSTETTRSSSGRPPSWQIGLLVMSVLAVVLALGVNLWQRRRSTPYNVPWY